MHKNNSIIELTSSGLANFCSSSPIKSAIDFEQNDNIVFCMFNSAKKHGIYIYTIYIQSDPLL